MAHVDTRLHDFCARFFAELRALGVHDAVVSPGSRSTPLALAANACGLTITVQLDERVGGFHALGQARATGRPSVLICTSGTAGANYAPAVIEAHHSAVPMIVCTADRPPELREWGAGQTIDQLGLYGSNVRWFHELPVAGEVDPAHARSVALRAVATAVDQAGPVHLNWPLREPLAPGAPIEVPAATVAPLGSRGRRAPSLLLARLAAEHERGLIVVGPADLASESVEDMAAFAVAHGWPIVADPASGFRSGAVPTMTPLITTGELLFGSAAFTRTLGEAEVIVRVGLSPTSKAYRLWLQAHRPDRLVLVAPTVEWSDPADAVTDVVQGPLPGLFEVPADTSRRRGNWVDTWLRGERTAASAVESFLAAGSDVALTELGVAGLLCGELAVGPPAILVSSNSMPIRDLDVVLRPADGSLRVLANRGANGIDGVVATATGVAQASGARTTVLIGDIAAVHDLGGLAAAARLGVDNLTVVVIDNNGGGIFSFLPVAGAIDGATFDHLFTTPHDTDLVGVADALGFTARRTRTTSEFLAALRADEPGPRLIAADVAIGATVDDFAEVRRAVDAAIGR